MAIVNLPSAAGAKTVEEVIDVVENMRKTVEFLLTNVDSDNITSVDSSKTDISLLKIDSLNLKDLVVTNAKIGLLAVQEANIALLAVTEARIANLSVGTAKIKDLAVTTAKIQDAAITNAKIDRATVDKLVVNTADIANLAVTTAKIENAAITTAKIGDAQITNAKIDLASVNKLVVQTANIADLSVTSAKIAVAAIGTTQIADASITDAKIVTLTANKLTAGTIDASLITVTNLVADNIVTGTITLASANLLENTMWKTDTAKWGLDTNNVRKTDVTYLGNYSLGLIQSGLAVDTWRGVYSEQGLIKAKPGEIFTASLYSYSDSVTGIDRGASMEINFLDSGGTRLAGYVATSVKPTQTGVWQRFTQTATAPTGTEFVRIYVYVVRNGRLWISRPMLQRGKLAGEWNPHTNELLAEKGITNFEMGDGAVTNRVIQAETITGDRLVVDTITAAQIASNTITANEMVVGTITAASGILANASIVTATIADLAVTNAKINSIDAVKITTGTLDAARIGANTISAEKLTVGDFTNYATINEFLPSSMVDVGAYGTTVIDTGFIKKELIATSYLMFCNYTPSPFKTGDVLYYEFYAKLVGATTDAVSVNAWGYNASKSYMSINNNEVITVTDTEQLFTGTITLTNANWATAAYFLFGFSSVANFDIRIRQPRVYRKMHGSLLVDGSITATNGIIASIDASKITTGSMSADRVNINVGARNLIKHTDFWTDWNASWWLTWSSNTFAPAITDMPLESGETLKVLVVRSIAGLANNTVFGIQTRGTGTATAEKFSLIAGKEYTISFLAAVHANAYDDFRYTYILNDGLPQNQQLSLSNWKKTLYGKMSSGFLLDVYKYEQTFTATYTCYGARLLLGSRTSADFTSTSNYGLAYVTNLMLEEGNKSSSWQVALEDTYGKMNVMGTYIDATGVYTGQINFNQGLGGTLKLGDTYGSGVLEVWSDINSDTIPDMVGRIDSVGAYFPNLSADSVRGDVENIWTLGNKVYYFDSTAGNDSNDGSTWALAKKNMQNFIDSLPKNLKRAALTLNFRNDILGGLLMVGFHSGDIIVQGNLNGSSVRARTFGRILLNNVADGAFTFQSFDAHGDATTTGTGVFSATHVNKFNAYDVDIYGNSKANHGFNLDNVKFSIGECEVYGISDRGLSAMGMCHGYFYNCRGSAPIAMYVNEASIVNGVGTRWSGTVSRQNNAIVGAYNSAGTDWVNDPWVVNTGSTPPAPPTPSTEITLTLAASTGDNYSSSGYWTNDEVKQGDWGYGVRYGLWYADLNAVKAKTIVSATITVYRGSGGSSSGRNIQFKAHNYYSRATRPAGTPTMSAAYARGPIAPGQTVTYDITDLVSAQIAAGSYRAIGVHTTGSTDYMALGTTPTITVRYR